MISDACQTGHHDACEITKLFINAARRAGENIYCSCSHHTQHNLRCPRCGGKLVDAFTVSHPNGVWWDFDCMDCKVGFEIMHDNTVNVIRHGILSILSFNDWRVKTSEEYWR